MMPRHFMYTLLPFVLIAAAAILFIGFGLLIASVFLISAAKRKRDERRKNNYEKELLLADLELKQHVIDNLTYEMRENIGQSLSLAKLTLSGVEPHDQPKKHQNLVSAKVMVTRAMNDLLGLLYLTNRRTAEDCMLAKALQQDLKNIGDRNDFNVTVDLQMKSPEILTAEHPILLRIAQEWLYFVAAWPGTLSIRLELTIHEDSILVFIIHESASDEMDSQLDNIKVKLDRRSSIIGATLNIEKNDLGKTFFSIYLPLIKP